MNAFDWLITGTGASLLLIVCLLARAELKLFKDHGMSKAVRAGNDAIHRHVTVHSRLRLGLWIIILTCLGFIGAAAWHIARAL